MPEPASVPSAAEASPAAESDAASISFTDLTALLLDTPGVYLSKVVEPHRAAAFSQEYTDYLAAESAAAHKAGNPELGGRLNNLMVRLANPLIRQEQVWG